MKIHYKKPLKDMSTDELLEVINDYEDDRLIQDITGDMLKAAYKITDVDSIKVVVKLAIETLGFSVDE